MKTERTIWVAYIQDQGFAHGKHGGVTNNFAKARVYNQRNHLSNSMGTHRIDSVEVIPVPIKLTIDPEVMTILTLGGKPVTE